MKSVSELSLEEYKTAIENSSFETAYREIDWGAKSRGQGKRTGHTVKGSMSAAPVGIKRYEYVKIDIPDYEEVKDDFKYRDGNEIARYMKSRNAGFTHRESMFYAILGNLDTSYERIVAEQLKNKFSNGGVMENDLIFELDKKQLMKYELEEEIQNLELRSQIFEMEIDEIEKSPSPDDELLVEKKSDLAEANAQLALVKEYYKDTFDEFDYDAEKEKLENSFAKGGSVDIEKQLTDFTFNNKEFNELQAESDKWFQKKQKLEEKRLSLIKKQQDTTEIDTQIKEAKDKMNDAHDSSMALLHAEEERLRNPSVNYNTGEGKFAPSDLPKDGSPIHIHMPALGGFPEKNVVLKYDKDEFIFDIYEGDKKVGKIGEKNVLSNLENGSYEFKDSPSTYSNMRTQEEFNNAILPKIKNEESFEFVEMKEKGAKAGEVVNEYKAKKKGKKWNVFKAKEEENEFARSLRGAAYENKPIFTTTYDNDLIEFVEMKVLPPEDYTNIINQNIQDYEFKINDGEDTLENIVLRLKNDIANTRNKDNEYVMGPKRYEKYVAIQNAMLDHFEGKLNSASKNDNKSHLPYKEASKFPKGGAQAMTQDHLQASAADAIAAKHGMRGEAIYNWANKHGINLVGDGSVGAQLSKKENRKDLMDDVLSDQYNFTKHILDKRANDGNIYVGFDLTDINGKKIKVGDTVKTTQPSGGILSPGSPEIGIVEKTKDAFGNDALQIRYRKNGDNFDRFILLNGKINEVVELNKEDVGGKTIESKKDYELTSTEYEKERQSAIPIFDEARYISGKIFNWSGTDGLYEKYLNSKGIKPNKKGVYEDTSIDDVEDYMKFLLKEKADFFSKEDYNTYLKYKNFMDRGILPNWSNHETKVSIALSEGKKVPKEVLDEYPDLKQSTPISTENKSTPIKPNDTIPEIVKRAMTETVTDIGQLSAQDIKDLNKYVKKGVLVKGKGGAFPIPKTVYAIKGFDIQQDRTDRVNTLLDEVERLEPDKIISHTKNSNPILKKAGIKSKKKKEVHHSEALDKKRKAKKPGKRTSASGETYFENRPDHSDKDGRKKLGKGGHLGFKKLARKVANNYVGKKVPKKFQKTYGKVYDNVEATEVGKKVAGVIKKLKGK